MVRVAPKGGTRNTPIRFASRSASTPNMAATHREPLRRSVGLFPQHRTTVEQRWLIGYLKNQIPNCTFNNSATTAVDFIRSLLHGSRSLRCRRDFCRTDL